MPPRNLPRTMGVWRTAFLLCLALLAEVAIFHRHVLFAPSSFTLPWDFRTVHLPLAAAASDAMRAGEFPWWDLDSYCGAPLFANIQTALFSPGTLAALLGSLILGHDSLAHLLAIAGEAMVWIGGIGTLLLVRRLGASLSAAFVSATLYQLGCFFASQAEHLGSVQAGGWLPFSWLAVVELRERHSRKWTAVLALTLALSVFAGFPQSAVAAFGSSLVLAIVLEPRRPRLALRTLGGWAWALAIAAVQFGPTAELTRNSVAKYRAEYLGSGGGIPLGALYSLIIPDYWSVFDLSKFHGPTDPTFLYLYSSLAGLALAAGAIVWKPNAIARRFALHFAVITLWILGDSTFIGRTVFEALPVTIRIGIHPEYVLCAFSLGIAVLGGLGADRLLPSPRLRLAVAAVIAADLTLTGSGRPFNVTSLKAEPGITRRSADGSPELATLMRDLSRRSTPPARFDTTDVSFHWANAAPLLEVPTAGGCDPLAPERIIQVRRAFADVPRWGTCVAVQKPDSPVLNLMNARYLLAQQPLAQERFRFITEMAGVKVYENPRAMPRFFLVGKTVSVANLAEASKLVQDPSFDPAAVAVLESPLPEGFHPVPEATGTVSVIDYRPAHLSLRVIASAPAILVATEAYYPGWQATLDGRAVPIHPTDAGFRGIAIPAGEHTVEMRYGLRFFYWLAPVSLAATAVAMLALRGERRI
ncbi:MAG: YfhO family protein [Bryobacteraceae bacterium]